MVGPRLSDKRGSTVQNGNLRGDKYLAYEGTSLVVFFSQLASDVTWSLPVKKVSALLELETKFQTTVGFILYSCSI